MIIWSYVHMAVWSYYTIIYWYDPVTIWTDVYLIIWSYEHMITWWYGRMIFWSFEHMIVWSYGHILSCELLIMWTYMVMRSYDCIHQPMASMVALVWRVLGRPAQWAIGSKSNLINLAKNTCTWLRRSPVVAKMNMKFGKTLTDKCLHIKIESRLHSNAKSWLNHFLASELSWALV